MLGQAGYDKRPLGRAVADGSTVVTPRPRSAARSTAGSHSDEHAVPAARNESREHRRQSRRWTPRPDSMTSRNFRARLSSR